MHGGGSGLRWGVFQDTLEKDTDTDETGRAKEGLKTLARSQDERVKC